MIIASQLRAARALIDMTTDDLARASDVSGDAIRSAESSAGSPDPEIAERLKRLFESKGIVFVGAGQQDASGPGVRLHSQPPDEGIRPQNLNATNDD